MVSCGGEDGIQLTQSEHFTTNSVMINFPTITPDCRNLAEYEGHVEIDNQLLLDLLKATK